VGLGGAAIAFLVVVPPYPFYNTSPEKWLPKGSGMAGSGIEIDGRRIN
jgi:signal peptidase complex subunit 1